MLETYQIHESLCQSLATRGLKNDPAYEQVDWRDRQLIRWYSYDFHEDGRVKELYLTVRIYCHASYINVWADKLWNGEAMGDGFIHMALRNPHDLASFLSMIDAAKL